MTNASTEVLRFLEREPAIRRCLSQRLINVSSLAKFIIHNSELDLADSSVDAVITAVRRSISDHSKESFDNIQKIFRNSKVTSKNQIAAIVLRKDNSSYSLLSNLFSSLDFYGGETLRVVKGSRSIMLLFDEENIDKVTKAFSPSMITLIRKNIGVVTLHLDPDVSKIYGVFSAILNELSINRINIIEAVTCISEYMIFVDEKDLIKAHEILYRLCSK